MSKFSGDRGYQAFRILQVFFIAAPILVGIDKFFHVMAPWINYVSPFVMSMAGGHGVALMSIVGVVEIIAGVGVLIKPRVFAYVVALWFLLIIINLLMMGQYLDIALRDVGLMLAALALGKLSKKYGA